MLSLLNFFEDTGASGGGFLGGAGGIIIIVVMIVLMVVMMIVPQRKQKKAQAEMQSKLAVGVTIMTIGGIIGEIIELTSEHVTIQTGTSTIKFTVRAIHSIVEEPAVNEGEANSEEAPVDEIK